MLSKKILLASLMILPFILGSCAGEQNSDLSVSYTGANTIYLIPSTTQSCYAKTSTDTSTSGDISARYFQVKNPTFTWKKTDADLYIVTVRVTINASQLSGGTFTGIISGSELASLNNTHGLWDGKVSRAASDTVPTVVPSSSNTDSTLKNAFCPLTFGAVSVVTGQDVDFQATGYVQIIGVQRDNDNNETPVTITTPITVNNIGLQN